METLVRRTSLVLGLTLAVGITLGVAGGSFLTTDGRERNGVLFNSHNTEMANSPVTRTIRGVAGTRIRLYGLDAWCSNGSSNVTVVDGNTTIWASGATEVGKLRFRVAWSPGLSASTGKDMIISLASCGSGNVGTLIIQAERF